MKDGDGGGEELGGMPPSAKLVYKALELEGEHDTEELVRCTGLPERTTRYAVGRLLEEEVIQVKFRDNDRVYYI